MVYVRPSRERGLARWLLLLVPLTLLLVVWQHQAILDWWHLYNYVPSQSVATLADTITVTPKARRIFYVNHPAIQDREAFNHSCTNRSEHTIVLGCYHPVDRGIYVFDVSDDRLSGIDQVTAAHEMLHAAYDRLSSKQRSKVNAMLQTYYDQQLHDERIQAIIDTYRKSEPNDILNEMHSIFGTEISPLPPELETYYRQYFTDRAKVVGYAQAYQAEFTNRQNQVTDYDKRLKDLKVRIDANSSELESQETQITALRARLESDRDADRISAYNANVPVYNAKIDTYNSLISATKDLISTYNDLVEKRNQLALQVTELAHSIDSSFTPISN